ncbi:putative DNA-binding WGR domain protein [Rhizobium leguminosarum]|jgi:predicted DNA-binding WGR domain protein
MIESSRFYVDTVCPREAGEGALRHVTFGMFADILRPLAQVPSFTEMNQSHVIDSNVSLDVAVPFDDDANMTVQPYHLYVERADPAKNMARYYAIEIGQTLFGEPCLTRRWGRIGRRGQEKHHVFEREEEAVRLFLDLVKQKRARGYRPKSTVRYLWG